MKNQRLNFTCTLVCFLRSHYFAFGGSVGTRSQGVKVPTVHSNKFSKRRVTVDRLRHSPPKLDRSRDDVFGIEYRGSFSQEKQRWCVFVIRCLTGGTGKGVSVLTRIKEHIDRTVSDTTGLCMVYDIHTFSIKFSYFFTAMLPLFSVMSSQSQLHKDLLSKLLRTILT